MIFRVIFTACLAASPVFANGLRPDPAAAGMNPVWLARIPARMQAFVDEGKIAGAVTLVQRRGHLAALDAVGYQDREAKTPLQPDTLFQIQSITKPMTCAGIMMLVDEGLVSLIDPVEKHLPEFKDQLLAVEATPAAAPAPAAGAPGSGESAPAPALVKPSRPITLYDLMTHTSGLATSPPRGFRRSEHTLAEGVAAVAKLPLQSEPGARWRYNSMGLATLGRIIEVRTGKPFEVFMAERFFAPLGMTDTHFFLPAEKESRLSAVYTEENGALVRNDRGDRFRRGAKSPSPDAGLYSTAADVARFYQMLLNGGTFEGRRYLSKAAVQTMTANHVGELKAGFFPGAGFGLGVALSRDPIGTFRYNSIGSFGHGGGYRTYAWVDPEKELVGVILMQRTNGGGDLADEINAFMAMAAAAID